MSPVLAGSQATIQRDKKMSVFGTNLRTARKVLGLSQQQLADRAGVRRPTVSEVESGRVSPSAELMEKLAAGIGSTVGHLIRE
jgi:transcriptional regulator with XRE-family HTH domain